MFQFEPFMQRNLILTSSSYPRCKPSYLVITGMTLPKQHIAHASHLPLIRSGHISRRTETIPPPAVGCIGEFPFAILSLASQRTVSLHAPEPTQQFPNVIGRRQFHSYRSPSNRWCFNLQKGVPLRSPPIEKRFLDSAPTLFGG